MGEEKKYDAIILFRDHGVRSLELFEKGGIIKFYTRLGDIASDLDNKGNGRDKLNYYFARVHPPRTESELLKIVEGNEEAEKND